MNTWLLAYMYSTDGSNVKLVNETASLIIQVYHKHPAQKQNTHHITSNRRISLICNFHPRDILRQLFQWVIMENYDKKYNIYISYKSNRGCKKQSLEVSA